MGIIRFGSDICGDFDAALSREWLETNGLGGYASGTVCGANSRRYHGLLVAALKPPVGRMVLLSKLEETVTIGDQSLELGCNIFPGAVHPEGYRQLEEFRLDPWPTWRWMVGVTQVEKSVFLLRGENTVVVEYRTLGATVSMAVRPLIAFRDYHATTHANSSLNPAVQVRDGVVTIQPYAGLTPLHFSCAGASVQAIGEWFYRFQYPREQERGLDFEEDMFQPFQFGFELNPGHPVRIVVSTEQVASLDLDERIERERALRPASSTDLMPALQRASADFIADRGKDKTIIAGYHWFTDWGRDTMISLPGLALETGQPELMKQVLRAFLPWMFQGVLPNRFPDAGEKPEYNATDATLWFVEAVRAYFDATGDDEFVQSECYEALKQIVDWRGRGTLHGIRVDADGLLTGGEPGVQLTWMDAKVNGRVITERMGKPVEIQALWFNTLCIIRQIATRAGDRVFAERCRKLAERARATFAAVFWNAAEGCLFDVVKDDGRDGAIRPNQLLAISLPHRILDDGERSASVLEVVKRDLLTPFGLRTLSPRDSRYCGRYEGGQESRDGAYHQGTVWPWPLGPYVSALFAVKGRNAATMAEARSLLDPFRTHLLEAGIGQISEIFDGDTPHQPRGCIAQAWSVGELLRIARETGA